MQRYAKLRHEGTASSAERRLILEAHRAEICTRLHELETYLQLIDWKIENYRQIESGSG